MDKSIFENYAGLEGIELLAPILRDFAGRAAVVSSFGAEFGSAPAHGLPG